jgi:hypothetical protein
MEVIQNDYLKKFGEFGSWELHACPQMFWAKHAFGYFDMVFDL